MADRHPELPEEISRIERFIAAYNAVDNHLQAEMGTAQTFRSVVDLWAKRHPWWRDRDNLHVYATLRNFLVHEKVRAYEYPCVPSEAAVRDLEGIRDRLVSPARLADEFLKEVAILSGGATLEQALELIHAKGFGRIPLYEGSHFLGMLTENGIVRALANSVARGKPLDTGVYVRTLLVAENRRKGYRFAPAEMFVSQVAYWFQENTYLEAVLISDNGQEQGHLRGLVTRGDVAGRIG